MDNPLIVFLIVVGILLLVSAIVFARRSKGGSFAWDIKTRLFQANSKVEDQQRPDIEQIQQEGTENKQTASSAAKSRQQQTGGRNNNQRIS